MHTPAPHTPFTNTRRYTYGVFAGACVVALVVLALYLWMSNTVRDTFVQIGTLQANLNTIVETNAHAKTVRALVRDSTTARAELLEYFVTDDALVAFLEAVKALSSGVGVSTSVSSVRPGKILDKEETLETITITLETTGTFAHSVHFLALLEQYPRVVQVSSARLTQNDDGAWSGLCSVVLTRVIISHI